MPNIVLYTAKSCPMCTMLKKKLSEKNIAYEENQNKELMAEKGFTHLPVLQVDETVMGLREAMRWVEECK